MNLLYAEHRELYKRKYGSGTQEEAVVVHHPLRHP
ncbi:hypothetical protein PC116_g1510 [Phytophthora cactorum]|uniref:Uncharacterized protein n=1 Tax=Phytophthora cactorum TaxID=29920 RepID=A0A8T1LS60_9STRA|nr:hypothetical protein Pcac1_g19469 [Phytophthora cactorum]KAG2950454.1 hypothetical protein PC117_g4445 [Phytophthora cactorum]KAG3039202.1 hypothetical protein PC119_g2351 [Phytophthora cactorum]KAG3189644.1 hypothetical protein C6341_g2128 [Phytophthora cactorum]KAG3192774.1 hypothetical protein PC128_g10399 [Phytophthora cactorum]